jgi:hypothetical protein
MLAVSDLQDIKIRLAVQVVARGNGGKMFETRPPRHGGHA